MNTSQIREGSRKRKLPWWLPIILFAFVFSFLTFFASGTIESEDGWLYLSVARIMYYEHKDNSPPQAYPEFNVNMNTFKQANGEWKSPGGFGYSLSLVPAVALSDVVLRHFGAAPPHYFPLESDWSVLFFADFVNVFWAAMLTVIVFLYGQALKLSAKEALLMSLVTVLATNLMALSTFGFPQIMFTTLLVLTFYLVKKSSQYLTLKGQLSYLVAAAVSFGAFAITYNLTFSLAILPLVIYFVLLQPIKKRGQVLKVVVILGAVGALIFRRSLILYLPSLLRPYPTILFEGLWGFLFSAGKSLFLYSPILLIVPIFWHKLKTLTKSYFPELVSFLFVSFSFIIVISMVWIPNPVGKTPIWNGGMAWGPRYAAPVLPFLAILAFLISRKLSKLQQRFLVIPLVVLGLLIQITGMSVSYLLQYAGLPFSINVDKTELSLYDYASFIPRYTPLLMMPRIVISRALKFPSTIIHGAYEVKFYDGFDVPYYAGKQIFRGFRNEGHIWYQNSDDLPVTDVAMTLENVPDDATGTESAKVAILSNNQPSLNLTLTPNQEINVDLNRDQLREIVNRNELSLLISYDKAPVVPHVIYIKSMKINDRPINLGSIDYPDVSSLGPKTAPAAYQWWGNRDSKPWDLWYMRARVGEQTFAFWWIKNLYYWDRPQLFFDLLFALNCGVFAISSWLILKYWKKL